MRSPSSDSTATSVGGGDVVARVIPLIRFISTPQYSGVSLVTIGSRDIASRDWACASVRPNWLIPQEIVPTGIRPKGSTSSGTSPIGAIPSITRSVLLNGTDRFRVIGQHYHDRPDGMVVRG
jgi:hypothetical protein